MRAAKYSRLGPAAEVLGIVSLEDPQPGPGEVRVRLSFSGVNPTDWKRRLLGPAKPPPTGQIPNQDGAGEIDAVGPNVDDARLGERVWVFHAAWNRPGGTAAEYVCVPAGQAVTLPPTTSMQLGASLGIPYITAHGALTGDGPVDGKTVLVTGGGGAVGHAAIELGAFLGARVIATASSPEKAESARQAGAEAVLDYRSSGYLDQLSREAPTGVDRIVDVAIGANFTASLEVLAPHGVIVCYASEAQDPVLPVRALMTRNATIRFLLVFNFTPQQIDSAISDITRALVSGSIRPLPTKVLPTCRNSDRPRAGRARHLRSSAPGCPRMMHSVRTADVAVIGLGAIGLPVCVHVSEAGFRVQAWNRTPGRAKRATTSGAMTVGDLGSIDAQIILTALPDMPQLSQVLDSGLEGVLRAGDVLVVLSTVSPPAMHQLEHRLADAGVHVLDAPVSGGDVGAWEGTLSVMVGGAADDLENCRPVLDAFSGRIEHLGPLGSGQFAKACNQIIVGTTLAAIGEALTLGRAAGLDDAKLLSVLSAGMAGSRAMEIKREKYLSGDFSPGGSIANQLKDLRIALESAAALGCDLSVAAIVAEQYQSLSDAGESGLDHSAVIHATERARPDGPS